MSAGCHHPGPVRAGAQARPVVGPAAAGLRRAARAPLSFVAAAGFCAALAAGQESAREALLLTGARVLDVAAGQYLNTAAVLVDGDRIVALFNEAPPSPPPRTRVIDVKGLTLVPGLGDMHAAASPGDEADADYFHAMGLAHGVTLYRVLDVPLPWAVSQRERISAGVAVAPRLYTSGPGLDGPPAFGFNVLTVRDADAARREARAQVRSTVDWISVGGQAPEEIVSAVIDEAAKGPGKDQAKGGAAGAARGGGRAASRAGSSAGPSSTTGRQPVRVAVAAGVVPMLAIVKLGAHSIEGLGMPVRTRAEYETALAGKPFPESGAAGALAFIWEQAPAADLKALTVALARGGTALVPRLAGSVVAPRPADLERDPALPYLPDARRTRLLARPTAGPADAVKDQYAKAYAAQARFVADVVRAKGIVATASDWSGPGYSVPGAAIHRELKLLVEAGLKPADAIRAATLNAATLVGAGGSLGQIKIGYKADLIAVEGDPLARIEDLARIRLVVRRGESFTPAILLAQAKRALR